MIKVMIKTAFFLLGLSIVFLVFERLGLTEVLAKAFQDGAKDMGKFLSEYL